VGQQDTFFRTLKKARSMGMSERDSRQMAYLASTAGRRADQQLSASHRPARPTDQHDD